jgi:hypothetical protein
MAVEREGGALSGPRDGELEDRIREVEQAATDWGVHVDAVEGRFVGALLGAIRHCGRMNLAALSDLEALFERTRVAGEGERRLVELLVDAGARALAMAREATETAASASVHAELEIDKSVARIAQEMGRKLLEESQRWLVLKQTERNRRDARRLATGVVVAAMAVFVGGYATAEWWSSTESAARQAVLEAVDRCWVAPLMVRMADGKTVETCRLADLTANRAD